MSEYRWLALGPDGEPLADAPAGAFPHPGRRRGLALRLLDRSRRRGCLQRDPAPFRPGGLRADVARARLTRSPPDPLPARPASRLTRLLGARLRSASDTRADQAWGARPLALGLADLNLHEGRLDDLGGD